ncbi:CidA/LrgA family protein [Bacillus sp. DNRA2]|uniref:CidA/LrgA family protein n=1 Tax=Bacillus sp. DNRA2 TaxID=2723053 RepID=UPI001B7D18E8|nr:CidA/LrgA family protein [Bacillus sp. DNRA2]
MKVRNIFNILLQLLVLWGIYQVGVFTVKETHLPIPGNVMGMILLFLLLCTGHIRLDWVEKVSSLLIKHLSFFFIPVSVGLMTLGHVIIKNGVALIIVLVISTLVGIVVSGSLSQALVTRKEAVQHEHHHHHV